jgi:hypothetical protein
MPNFPIRRQDIDQRLRIHLFIRKESSNNWEIPLQPAMIQTITKNRFTIDHFYISEFDSNVIRFTWVISPLGVQRVISPLGVQRVISPLGIQRVISPLGVQRGPCSCKVQLK